MKLKELIWTLLAFLFITTFALYVYSQCIYIEHFPPSNPINPAFYKCNKITGHVYVAIKTAAGRTGWVMID